MIRSRAAQVPVGSSLLGRFAPASGSVFSGRFAPDPD